MSSNKTFASALTGAAMLAVLVLGTGCTGTKKSTDSVPQTAPDASGIQTSGMGGSGSGNGSLLGSGAGDLSQRSVYFDYDSSTIKPESEPVVAGWARFLSANTTAKVRLEGNTDERGTREYNVALGERRSNSVAQELEAKGVSAAQISVVSYGEERPVAPGHDESAWSQNRRVDIVQQ